MLIKGKNLNATQRQLVLSAYIYRWTHENGMRKTSWMNVNGKPTIPLVSDQEWLDQHAFHFIKDGSRLHRKYDHCEPEYVADES